MGIFGFFSSEPTVEQNPDQKPVMPPILIRAGIKPKLYNDYCTAMDELRFEDAIRIAQEIDHFVTTSGRLDYFERKQEAGKYAHVARLHLASQKQQSRDYKTAYKLYYECYTYSTQRVDHFDQLGYLSAHAAMNNIAHHLDIEISTLLNSLEAMQLQESDLDRAEQIIAELADIIAVYKPGEQQFAHYQRWQAKIAAMRAMQGLNSKAAELATSLSLKKFAQDKHVLHRYGLELEEIIKKYEAASDLSATSLERLHACNEKLAKLKTILFIHEIIQHQQQVLAAIDEFDLSLAQKHLQNGINEFAEFSSDQVNDIAREFNLAKKQNLCRKSFVLALNGLQAAMDNIKDLQPKRALSESVLQSIKDKVVSHLNQGKLNPTELDLTINGFDQEVMSIIDKDFYKLVLLTELELDIYINGLANIFVDNVTELSTLERYRYWTNAGVKIAPEPKVLRELQSFTKDFTTTQVEAKANQIRVEVLAALAAEDNVIPVEIAPPPVSISVPVPEPVITQPPEAAPVLTPAPVDTLIFSKPEIAAPETEPESAPREHSLQKRH